MGSAVLLILSLALLKPALSTENRKVEKYSNFGQRLPDEMWYRLCDTQLLNNVGNASLLCAGGVDVNEGCKKVCVYLLTNYNLCVPVQPSCKNKTDRWYNTCGCTNSTQDYRTAKSEWYFVTGEYLPEDSLVNRSQVTATGFAGFYVNLNNC